MRYSPGGANVIVSWSDTKDGKARFAVQDKGLGIAKEHLNRITERFYRVDKSGARSEGGSGLGLSIVKHIIDAHQENLFVDSKYGIGSEFSFTLSKEIS